MKKKYFIMAASLATVLLLALFFLPRKPIPRNDGDLRFLRPTVSSNENAFHLLEKAGEEIYWPESKESKGILDWNSWDAKQAGEILNENQKALGLIDAALLRPRFQAPEIQKIGEEYAYLGNWKDISRVALLRSIASFREGKEQEALDSTLRVVRFGHQIEDCGGAYIHYLVGSAVKLLALTTLRDMIEHSTLSCDAMQFCRQELDQLFANQPGLTNTIKLEYQLQASMIDDMGKNMGLTNTMMGSVARVFNKPFFNAEKTRQIFANDARIKLEAIPQRYSDILTNEMAISTNKSVVNLVLSGNAIGNVLARMSLQAGDKFLSKKCRENVSVSATQILLALKCYKLKYDALPNSLNDLVPEFLPAVPMDDFDGKPLRYSKDKKTIYSVGLDLVDEGGRGASSERNSPDLPFQINF